MHLVSAALTTLVLSSFSCLAAEESTETGADKRMALMRLRTQAIRFNSDVPQSPQQLQPESLFRYDDLTRGFVDGAVWRLGKKGRPRVIITTELHRNFFGAGPKIIYEFLSLTDDGFRATSPDFSNWTPSGTGLTIATLPDAAAPADSIEKRGFQMKQQLRRFAATQVVEGQSLVLRQLPRPVDRYQPDGNRNSDGAVFLFAAGRMPAVLLLLETDGQAWKYGLGRLSRPSDLIVTVDGTAVWKRSPSPRSWQLPFTSTNAPAVIP